MKFFQRIKRTLCRREIYWRIRYKQRVGSWHHSADCDGRKSLGRMLWVRFCDDPGLRANWFHNDSCGLEFGVRHLGWWVRALNERRIRRIFSGDANRGKCKALLAAMSTPLPAGNIAAK